MKITIKVRPNSGRQEIYKIDESTYKVFLKKQPIEGKANSELVKFLKKHFKKPIKILKGSTSKNKLIELAD
jgi:uncharacterized protein